MTHLRERSAIFFFSAAMLSASLGTVWMLRMGELNGVPWAMGNIGVYLTEIFFLGYVVCRWQDLRRACAPFGVQLALLFLTVLVSSLLASDHLLALSALSHLVLAVCVLLVMLARSGEDGIAEWWALGSLLSLMFALAQIRMQTVLPSTILGIASHPLALQGTSVVGAATSRILRAYGTFPHPNILGGYAVLSILVFALAARNGSRFKRIALAILSAAFGVILILSFSRSALVFAVILFALLVLKRRLAFTALGPAILGAALAAAFVAPALEVRVGATDSRLEALSVHEREQSLLEGVQLFRHAPLFGVGPMNSPLAIAERIRPGDSGYSYQPPHAVPILLLAETGIFGTLAALWLLFAVLKQYSSKAIRIATLALLVLGCFDHYIFTSVQFPLLVAVFFGILSGSYEPD